MNKIKAIPTSICGVFLALLSLGNFWSDYTPYARIIFGIIGILALVMLLLKIILFPKLIIEDMKNPVTCGVSATLFMGLSIFASYLQPYTGLAVYLWYLCMILHLIHILGFTYYFVIKAFHIEDFFPTYFISYTGFAVNGIVAPYFKQLQIGRLAFYFGIGCLFFLYIIMIYRYLKHKEIAKHLHPLFCLFTSPINLCLVAHLDSFINRSFAVVLSLFFIGLGVFLIVLTKLPKLIRYPFYPSYSSFTYPFVVSATATRRVSDYLIQIGHPVTLLKYLYGFQAVLATALTLYTLARFLHFSFVIPTIEQRHNLVEN